MALHQRSNPYNKHLPFAGDVDSDADKFLAEIKDRLREAIRKNDLRRDSSKWLFNLHNITTVIAEYKCFDRIRNGVTPLCPVSLLAIVQR